MNNRFVGPVILGVLALLLDSADCQAQASAPDKTTEQHLAENAALANRTRKGMQSDHAILRWKIQALTVHTENLMKALAILGRELQRLNNAYDSTQDLRDRTDLLFKMQLVQSQMATLNGLIASDLALVRELDLLHDELDSLRNTIHDVRE